MNKKHTKTFYQQKLLSFYLREGECRNTNSIAKQSMTMSDTLVVKSKHKWCIWADKNKIVELTHELFVKKSQYSYCCVHLRFKVHIKGVSTVVPQLVRAVTQIKVATMSY